MADVTRGPAVTVRRSVRRPGIGRMVVGGVGLLPVIGVAALWELIARVGGVSPIILPPFTDVMKELISLTTSGELLTALGTTTYRAAAGLALGAVIGIVIGLAMARIRSVEWFFDPLVAVGFPTPTITLLPVFILWFGTGDASKVLLVALTCFFPMVTATYSGAKSVPPVLIWSARAMGTTERALFRRVVLPATLPFIFSGIRIAVPLAVIVDFVAEMVGGGGGLGYTLIFGYRFLETNTVFAALVAVLIFGLVLDGIVVAARARLLRWADQR